MTIDIHDKLTFVVHVKEGDRELTTYSVSRHLYSMCQRRARQWLRKWCRRNKKYLQSRALLSKSILTGEFHWEVIVSEVDLAGQRILQLRKMNKDVVSQLYREYFGIPPSDAMPKEKIIQDVMEKEQAFLSFLSEF